MSSLHATRDPGPPGGRGSPCADAAAIERLRERRRGSARARRRRSSSRARAPGSARLRTSSAYCGDAGDHLVLQVGVALGEARRRGRRRCRAGRGTRAPGRRSPGPAPIPITGISIRAMTPRRPPPGSPRRRSRSSRPPAAPARRARRASAALGGAALGLVAAERGRGLRRQADVAHDRDPGVDDRPGALDAGAAALELDGVAAGLLDEALGGGDRLLVGGLVGAEGQVADQERRAQPAAHGAGEHEHLVERDRHRRRVAEHGHRAGVADQHDVDAGLLGRPAPRGSRRR